MLQKSFYKVSHDIPKGERQRQKEIKSKFSTMIITDILPKDNKLLLHTLGRLTSSEWCHFDQHMFYMKKGGFPMSVKFLKLFCGKK